MDIYVASGKGVGDTLKSAFDEALFQIGIADFNIIYLSSILPQPAQIIEKKYPAKEAQYANKMYAIVAQELTDIPGNEVWAGLAWARQKNGKGLFVESHGDSKAFVENYLQSTMLDLMKRRGKKYGEISYHVAGLTCKTRPVCAMVAACYKSEGWK
ncbi:MAG: hypothetical protein A2666_05525 [Parcubacteria group bacterium RIFCSPHIGHO2_01_FULL_47_10b]|nr:MAG: hypothetical protein A2666_05525 [Parcubacteria group bacterium RIFCSPHIGHO2_01_FULL_47_10b]